MRLFEAVRIAIDVLAQNKMRTALTMLGIIIGVFAVVTLISLGHGAQVYVADQFAGMGTNLLVVTPGKRETSGGPAHAPPGANSAHKLTREDADAIRRRLSSVTGVAPVVYGLGLVKNGPRTRNTFVFGTGPEFPDVRNIRPAIGSFFSAEDVDASRRVVLLGTLVKNELFGDENALGRFVQVMGSPYRVIGVMEHRGNSLGMDLDDVVLVPVSAAQRLFNVDSLAQIVVQAQSEGAVPRAEAEIKELITSRHNREEDITIVTQTQMLSTLNTILGVLTATLAGIAAISLIVGGIGIMNIMLVSVRERTREIGLRKAVGARSRDILAQFLVESVVLSLIGGAIGILLAFGIQVLGHLIMPTLPIAITAWAITLAVSFSLVVGIFFGVYPARRAAKLDPIEALRTN
jgi:putative ABC transport system permease protein